MTMIRRLTTTELDALIDLVKDKRVLQVAPRTGELAVRLADFAYQVWTIGTPLQAVDEHEPTLAAELIHTLESGSVHSRIIPIITDWVTALDAVRFMDWDVVILDAHVGLVLLREQWSRTHVFAERVVVLPDSYGVCAQFAVSVAESFHDGATIAGRLFTAITGYCQPFLQAGDH